MKKLLLLIIILCFSGNSFSQKIFSDKFAHTYSIVARDPETGEMGVAVQSHWFSVGTIVSWAEAGVGAIATQSFVNASFGPRGLEFLKKGMTAQQVVDQAGQLTPDQLHFVEVFIRCEGKITRVQEELGVSYPTVRSRLEEIIRALGYEVGDERSADPIQRQEVLERLARKEITSEEAFKLLNAE